MNKHFRVKWEIDIEEEWVENPIDAAQEAWKTIMDESYNSWTWEVEDMRTWQKWEVDCETDPYEITEINNQ